MYYIIDVRKFDTFLMSVYYIIFWLKNYLKIETLSLWSFSCSKVLVWVQYRVIKKVTIFIFSIESGTDTEGGEPLSKKAKFEYALNVTEGNNGEAETLIINSNDLTNGTESQQVKIIKIWYLIINVPDMIFFCLS